MGRKKDVSLLNHHSLRPFTYQTKEYVLPPSHTSHYLSAVGGDRPRLWVDAHRLCPYSLRIGAGHHRRTDYPE